MAGSVSFIFDTLRECTLVQQQDACVMHVVAKSAKKGRRDAEAAEVAET